MKYLALALLLSITSQSALSNVVFSGHLLHQRWSPKDFAEQLPEMELIFFLKPEEKHLKETYEEVFSTNWKLCKYRIVDDIEMLSREVKNNPNKNKCFLSVIGYHKSGTYIISNPYNQYKNSCHYLCLWRPVYDRDGKLEYDYEYKVAIPLLFNQKEHAKLNIEDNYDEKNSSRWFRYHNWKPSYIGLYLRMMDLSIKRDARDIFYTPQSSKKFNYQKTKALWTGELLIPEYTFDNRMPSFSNHYENLDEPIGETKKNELLSLYKWKYRVVDEHEMEQALEERNENTFYLFFQRGGISAIDIRTGDIVVHIVFTPRQAMDYELNNTNMKRFVKTLEKLRFTM